MGQDTGTNMESILLVDDQPANLQVLLETLGSLGCKLLVAKSGEAALTIVQKARPDLILLDIMMPGIDGFEVCRRLKADPHVGSTMVLLMAIMLVSSSRCSSSFWIILINISTVSSPKLNSLFF